MLRDSPTPKMKAIFKKYSPSFLRNLQILYVSRTYTMPSTYPFHLTAVKFIALIKFVGQYDLQILQFILSAYFFSVFMYLTLHYQVHTT